MTLSERAKKQSAKERVAPLAVLDEGDERRVLVHEIYTSIQGEGTRTGRPCTFVRLTGCHLRCSWCDTEHAFAGGEVRTVDDVVAAVKDAGVPLVLVTGGEPLLQRGCAPLLAALADAGLEVLLETSGGVSTARVDARVVTILDVKTPSSGEDARNVVANYARLRAHDEVKLVIADEADYEFAKDALARHRFDRRCTVLLSPVAGAIEPRRLAEWIVRDRLPVRFQVQLHRVLWGDRAGV